jgi:hypothetical protein
MRVALYLRVSTVDQDTGGRDVVFLQNGRPNTLCTQSFQFNPLLYKVDKFCCMHRCLETH